MAKENRLLQNKLVRQNPETDILEYSWDGKTNSHFFGEDKWVTNSWLPNDKTGGMPSEIIFCHEVNKYYVYCTSYLVVLDGSTKNIVTRIFISDRGTIDESGVGWNASYYCERKLEFNPVLKCLYCATEDEKLKVIDCTTDRVIQTLSLSERIENLICEIYYNPASHTLSWLISGYRNKALLRLIDGRDNTLRAEREFPGVSLYKVTGDNTGGRLFASGEKHGTISGKYVWVLDESTLDTLAEIPVAYAFVNMIFNQGFNKLYLAPFQDPQAEIVGVISCEPGSYTYLRSIPVHGFPKRMTQNTIHNRIFTCGGWGDGIISIIDGSTDAETAFADIELPNSLYFSEGMDAVFCGGKNRIIKISGNSNTISSQSHENFGGISFSLSMDEAAKTMVSGNPAAGHITIFDCNHPDPELPVTGYRQLGGSSYFGCYNRVSKKYYFIQNDSSSSKSFVNIYHANTHKLNNTLILEGASMLSGCTYNDRYNKVFIAAYGSNKIFVLSGEDDLRVNGIISDLAEPKKIQDIPDWGMVICGGKEKIYIIAAKNNKILATIKNPGEAFVSDFVHGDLFPDVIYAGCFFNKQVLKINLRNFTIESKIDIPGSPPHRPVYLGYNPEDHFLVAVCNPSPSKSRVVIIDEATFTIKTLLDLNPWSYEPVYNPYTRSIYILNRGSIWTDKFGGLIEIRKEMGEFITKKITIKGLHSNGLIFNPGNNRMYLHTFYDPFTAEKESSFVAVDCTENVVKSIGYLGQKQNFGENAAIYSYDEAMVLIPDSDRLVIGNRGFSNLSIVQCFKDQLSLSEGWQWISFPRLERYGNDPSQTVETLGKISCFPDAALELIDQDNLFKQWKLPEKKWEGTLEVIQSTRGYKLNIATTYGQIQLLRLSGALISSKAEIMINAHIETWIGYFMEFSQYPWDAFPEWLYKGQLVMIKAQHWTMMKIMGIWKISGKVKPIKYGDMVIVKTSSSDPSSFTWNEPSIPEPEPLISKPEHYRWEEKPDYVPVYIQIPEQNDAVEIAVKANGKCIGATVRKPGETLVEVDAYISGLPTGTEIIFETWNRNKSEVLSNKDYRVISHENRPIDERGIIVGEEREYYEVIFIK